MERLTHKVNVITDKQITANRDKLSDAAAMMAMWIGSDFTQKTLNFQQNAWLLHKKTQFCHNAKTKLFTFNTNKISNQRNNDFLMKMITKFARQLNLNTLWIYNFRSIDLSVPKSTSTMLESTNRTVKAAVFHRHSDALRLDRFDHACIISFLQYTKLQRTE